MEAQDLSERRALAGADLDDILVAHIAELEGRKENRAKYHYSGCSRHELFYEDDNGHVLVYSFKNEGETQYVIELMEVSEQDRISCKVAIYATDIPERRLNELQNICFTAIDPLHSKAEAATFVRRLRDSEKIILELR